MAYINNAVSNLKSYGYGDTESGVTPFNPNLTSYPDYFVNKYETFFVELGELFVPALNANRTGYYITYPTPGLAYKKRLVWRPTWVPKRKDFFIIDGSPIPTQNGTLLYDTFNAPGEPGEEVADKVLFQVQAAGFMSRGKVQLFNNNYRDIFVSALGQYTVQYFTFPYTNVNNPRPGLNYDGVQVGTIIKFFSEDEFSIICFQQVQDIRTAQNIV